MGDEVLIAARAMQEKCLEDLRAEVGERIARRLERYVAEVRTKLLTRGCSRASSATRSGGRSERQASDRDPSRPQDASWQGDRAGLAHAAMMWLTRRFPLHASGPEVNLSGPERAWVTGIFTKVVCQVEDEVALREVYEKAKVAGLEANLVIDCGLTEFGGVPTATAVGVGPDEAEKIDAVTGGLKLY